jgi:AcrR family transcriptional regulator
MKDRRVRKTKQAIQAAFSKLLSEKSMEDITVKNLCEMADINKSTFYLHYKDIYDCADCLRDAIVDEFSIVIAPYSFSDIIDHLPIILENIMKIFETNKEIYMPFLKSPSLAPTLCKIKQLMIEKVLERMDEKERTNVIYRCSVSFVISGIISVLEQHDFTEISHQTISALADKVQHGFTC